MKNYRIIDHEADVGFEVYGSTEEEVFTESARALFSLIADMNPVRPIEEKRRPIAGYGEPLVIFLNDLLYLWDTEQFLPKEIAIEKKKGELTAILKGERFDETRHTAIGAVKAVTYHRFFLGRNKGRFKATFIVDL